MKEPRRARWYGINSSSRDSYECILFGTRIIRSDVYIDDDYLKENFGIEALLFFNVSSELVDLVGLFDEGRVPFDPRVFHNFRNGDSILRVNDEHSADDFCT